MYYFLVYAYIAQTLLCMPDLLWYTVKCDWFIENLPCSCILIYVPSYTYGTAQL